YRRARKRACRAAQFRLGGPSFTKLLCPCALGKTEADHLSGHEIILLADTLTWRPVAEIKMKLLHAISRSKWRGICLADIGGPGLDLSGNLMCARTLLINRERVRCWRFGAAARREEGEYPLWIFDRRATPLQRQRSATLRAKLWRPAGGVAPQSQSGVWLCFFVAPCQSPARA